MTVVNSATSRNPAEILAHNVREHVEVVYDLLGGLSGVTEEAKARLLAHIAEEEKLNRERLNVLMSETDTPAREIRLIRDHSEMLLDILEGAIPPALGHRLLHHVMEEHAELVELGRHDTSSGGGGEEVPGLPTYRLSLGSLRNL
jgi:hypothetical protein